MKFKSETCFGRNGEPLNSYTDKSEAASHAAFIKSERGISLVPYDCERCGYRHLSPPERFTESSVCQFCKAGNGQNKDLYKTRRSAQRRAEILRIEKGVSLQVYACPAQLGWHLTSRSKPR